MNNNAETSFRKWLSELKARTYDLKNRVDGLSVKQLEKELGFVVAFWERIIDFKQRQNIDVAKYESQMFEVESDHKYIAIVLERKSKELVDKYWINLLANRLEFVDGILRSIGFH